MSPSNITPLRAIDHTDVDPIVLALVAPSIPAAARTALATLGTALHQVTFETAEVDLAATPQAQLLIVTPRADVAIAAAMEAGADPKSAIDTWAAEARGLLALTRRYQGRARLLSADALTITDPHALRDIAGLSDLAASDAQDDPVWIGAETETVPATPDPVYRMMATLALLRMPKLAALAAEIEARSTPLDGDPKTPSAAAARFDIADQLDLAWQAYRTQAETTAARLTEIEAEAETRIATLAADHARRLAELEADATARLADQKVHLDTVTAEIVARTAEVEAARDEAAHQARLAEDRAARVSALDLRINAMQHTLAADRAALVETRDALRSRLATLEAEHQTLLAESKTTRQALSSTETARDDAVAALEVERTEHASTQAALETLRLWEAKAREQIATLTAELDESTTAKTSALADLDTLRSWETVARHQITELTFALDGAEARAARGTSDLAQMQHRLEAMTDNFLRRLDCATADARSARRKLVEAQEQRKIDMAELDARNDTIAQHMAEIGHLQAGLAAMRASTSWRVTAPIRTIRRAFARH